MVNAVSPRTTLWRMGSMPSLLVCFSQVHYFARFQSRYWQARSHQWVCPRSSQQAHPPVLGSATTFRGKRFIHLQSVIACNWTCRRIQTRGDFTNGVPVQCFYNLIGGIRNHTTFICNGFARDAFCAASVVSYCPPRRSMSKSSMLPQH